MPHGRSLFGLALNLARHLFAPRTSAIDSLKTQRTHRTISKPDPDGLCARLLSRRVRRAASGPRPLGHLRSAERELPKNAHGGNACEWQKMPILSEFYGGGAERE